MALLFRKKHLEKILEGEKTQTRRIRKPRVKTGSMYRLRRGYYPIPELIEIEEIFQQKLGEITPEEVLKEGFNSFEEFVKEWESIYDEWEPEKKIWVIEFRLTEKRELTE
ncbi:ASCH domain-containing protein [Candidatus Bathyarchaeota archaeon]|nr:ASCH domain-containing protein [Candidatus Bathyarchaeota archaeon]